MNKTWSVWFAVAAVAVMCAAELTSGHGGTSPKKPVTQPTAQTASLTLSGSTANNKKVRSCNKGDDRKKRHTSSALNAWAVACEYPPRSEVNTGTADAAASAALVGGG